MKLKEVKKTYNKRASLSLRISMNIQIKHVQESAKLVLSSRTTTETYQSTLQINQPIYVIASFAICIASLVSKHIIAFEQLDSQKVYDISN